MTYDGGITIPSRLMPALDHLKRVGRICGPAFDPLAAIAGAIHAGTGDMLPPEVTAGMPASTVAVVERRFRADPKGMARLIDRLSALVVETDCDTPIEVS